MYKDKQSLGNTSLIPTEKSEMLIWMEKYSDFEKLQRVVVKLLGTRRQAKTPCEEREEALIRICFCLQQFYFRDELELLLNHKTLPATSKYKSLSLFVEKGSGVPLLRVGGRLAQSDLPYDAKHQILLPKQSETVRALVRFLHYKNLHAGTQALMAILRQRFWIVHSRGLVRSVTRSCVRCFRCRPKLSQQVMGDLPAARVSVAKPFASTGVDFCGPVTTTYKLRGCRTTKSYIAVFICFATKAVHMEVVSDLTAKAFLASLKRFVARRGLCSRLFCDNATNFVGTRRELEEMKKRFFDEQVQGKISKYCAANNINFHHIPPRSPHFGGLWEAAVKSAKYHLSRILGNAFLTFEELATVVAEVEAVLNSRPLTVISNDPNDEQVLTPAHFLVGGPLVGISESTTDSKEWSHLERWLRISAIKQHFWKRWSSEYLHELQQKVKWTEVKNNLIEGDMVLVAEDNLPPKTWLMGRVINVIKDERGSVRVADVKTKHGEIRRAIQKLAPLPKEI
ncbi:uncharacterized protein LOC142224858 [Haematobia irritans]|uniref:uncharacterized protein LOC142224858 n=1 Tax=Haematobia irritans TaxID=7368 RepID=UPI003F50934E